MSNFINLTSAHRQRIDELASRLIRVESHIRRGEKRAARARLQGFYREAEALLEQLELPYEFVLVGANVGMLSGKGSLLRGRLPAALLGAVAGWMVGQINVMRQEEALGEVITHAQHLQMLLQQADAVEA